MPVPKVFPSQAELDRVKRECELYYLFACKDIDPDKKSDRWKFRLAEFFESDEKKAKLLDTALHVAPVVIESGTDFLFGEAPKIEITGNDDAQKKLDKIISRNDLLRKLSENCDLTQAVGHGHFKVYTENGEAYVQEVPYSTYFPDWSNVPMGQDTKNPRLAFSITTDSTPPQNYIYIEDYYIQQQQKVCYIEYSLWKDNGGQIGEQIPLSTLGLTAGMKGDLRGQTFVQQTTLDELPIVSVNLRKTALDRYGRSTLERVKPLLNELNDRVTQISLQFLKHLNARMQIPAESVPREKDGSVKATKIDVFLAKQGDPDAKYITNDNPLIEQAFTHIEKIIRKICKLTATPDTFLTEDDKGGIEKAEALKVRLMQFLKRQKFLQTVYEQAITKLVLLALKAEGVKTEGLEVKVTFDLGLPKDWESDAQVWGEALAQGLASRETAVSRFQGIDGDALDAEVEKIKEEETAMQQSMLAQMTPPQDNNQPQV